MRPSEGYLELYLDLDAIRRPSTLRYARLPLLMREENWGSGHREVY